MQNDSELKTRIHNLCDEELVEMIKKASEYRPEAILYAEEELSRRGALDSVRAEIEISQQHEEEKRIQEEEKRIQEWSSKPLFLYISPARLVLLSIASMGVYEAYWIYRNWRYIKERDGLNIRPFWRGIFGILFCHSLLRRIHDDKDARAVQEPTFSPGGLATGWVILVIFANIVSRAPSIAASIIAAFIPSFLCLVPVQCYINSVAEKRNPNSKMYGWSLGHIVCLVFGLITWALLLIGLGAGM